MAQELQVINVLTKTCEERFQQFRVTVRFELNKLDYEEEKLKLFLKFKVGFLKYYKETIGGSED